MSRILIVEDVSALHEQYAYDLNRFGGHETLTAANGKEALEILEREPVDCVILDLELPGVDGFEVLKTLQARGEKVPVIVYTGTGNYDRCVRAVKLGAYSFIDKAEPIERVVREVENALEKSRLVSELTSLRRQLGSDTPLIGSSAAMQELKQSIGRVAPVPSPVLILGESGSGKELVARELHRLSKQANGPFLAVNSAALPESLVESELFGHERGAFTGADRTHKGAFEAASRGTLFLDEIGDLPPAAQAKLLRVLEEGTVTRVGANKPVRVDARVVAATNRDLEAEIRASRFRHDLFYRINVHLLRVPPLRERLSDIPELVEHFLGATCSRFGVRQKSISPQAARLLASRSWERNNVRELRNVVEQMVIACDGDRIEEGDVPGGGRAGGDGGVPQPGSTLQEQKLAAERKIILAALERNDWHITRSAAELGLADHSSLLKIMRRHRLKRR